MNPSTLEIDLRRRVAVVRLARERVRNAFDETSIAELTATFTALGANPEVRAIVLAARGPAFCAGADLEWMRKMAGYSLEENRADAGRLAAMLATLASCPKPVIARVHGDAFAGGVGLVAACDLVVASEEANFCLSEVKLGLIPATIAPYVIRAMGARQAQRYFLTAERFSAARAREIGLVHEVTPAARLDDAIEDWLTALLSASGEAVSSVKQLVAAVAGRAIDEALMAETVERIASARASADGREGVASFLEKRKPRWQQEFEAEQAALNDEEEM